MMVPNKDDSGKIPLLTKWYYQLVVVIRLLGRLELTKETNSQLTDRATPLYVVFLFLSEMSTVHTSYIFVPLSAR